MGHNGTRVLIGSAVAAGLGAMLLAVLVGYPGRPGTSQQIQAQAPCEERVFPFVQEACDPNLRLRRTSPSQPEPEEPPLRDSTEPAPVIVAQPTSVSDQPALDVPPSPNVASPPSDTEGSTVAAEQNAPAPTISIAAPAPAASPPEAAAPDPASPPSAVVPPVPEEARVDVPPVVPPVPEGTRVDAAPVIPPVPEGARVDAAPVLSAQPPPRARKVSRVHSRPEARASRPLRSRARASAQLRLRPAAHQRLAVTRRARGRDLQPAAARIVSRRPQPDVLASRGSGYRRPREPGGLVGLLADLLEEAR